MKYLENIALREQDRPQPVLNNNDNAGDDALSDGIEENLPIKSTEELEAWERKLASKEEQKKMVAFLTKVGGRDTNSTVYCSVVKNIVRKVLTDSVAAQFNWEGKKGKKMLSSLIISECIKKAAALSHNVKSTTEQDIINAIKNWLRHATARLNNKKNKIENEQDD
ncbi:unnamed protein product [Brassicogethes aeneus]|uniref:DUF4806 domain-containing protein n=1 Tax=Brassicogethes aeneus TaxID=1431903 RepID=A0A9P0AQE6_BRAAE|nr:unnamed protein product [Brassicogethes aeneus]